MICKLFVFPGRHQKREKHSKSLSWKTKNYKNLAADVCASCLHVPTHPSITAITVLYSCLLHTSAVFHPLESSCTKNSSWSSTALLTFPAAFELSISRLWLFHMTLSLRLNPLPPTPTPPTFLTPTPRLQWSGTTRVPSHIPTHIHKMRSGSVAELGQDVMGSNVLPSRVLSRELPGFK